MALDLGIFLEGAQSTFKVKVSENDAQAQYLIDKLISSDGSVTITETNDGGIETIDLTVAGGSDTNIANTDLTNDANHSINLNTFKQGFTNGEVGIGTATPDNSSQLEVSATDKGLLIPRVTTAQMNAISTPATNLLVFNTDLEALYRYDGANWVALSAGYGVIEVITDADSGIPTYFADLQSALETCKTSGSNNTVTLYSDITITSAIIISSSGSGVGGGYLYDNLTINFNGFKVINNQADNSNCFTIAPAGRTTHFTNGEVVRTNGTSTHYAIDCTIIGGRTAITMNKMIWYNANDNGANFRYSSAYGSYLECDFDWGGSLFYSAGTALTLNGGSGAERFRAKNFTAISSGATSSTIDVKTSSNLSEFSAFNLAGGIGLNLSSNSDLSNFYVETTTGTAIRNVSVTMLSNFRVVTTSGAGIDTDRETGSFNRKYSNFAIQSQTGRCIIEDYDGRTTYSNFTCYSNTANDVVYINRAAEVTNGHVINFGSGRAFSCVFDVRIVNCYFLSIGGVGAYLWGIISSDDIVMTNTTIESRWDNSGGHALEVNDANSNIFISNCQMLVANAGANCVTAGSAETISLGNSAFKGATTPVHANVTISLTSAPDSNGNYTV